jgi:hypothetical protein
MSEDKGSTRQLFFESEVGSQTPIEKIYVGEDQGSML